MEGDVLCLVPAHCYKLALLHSTVLWKIFLISNPNQFNLQLTLQMQKSICERAMYKLQYHSVRQFEPCRSCSAYLEQFLN